jgi:hypothetical protein
MIHYSERVELLPNWRRALEVSLGLLGACATVWAARYVLSHMKGSPWDQFPNLLHMGLALFATLGLLHDGLFSTDRLEIDDDTLTLKRGLLRRRIPLEDIVEAKAVRNDTVRRTYLGRSFPYSLDGFFLVMREHPHVRLLITGGKTMFVATQRPTEMAEILRRGSKRSPREGVLRLLNSRAHYGVPRRASPIG